MRVLLYLRVSTEGQARKENPIATQRTACLEYASREGYEVDEERDIYIDGGISGRSTTGRFAFREIMERIKTDTGVAGIVAYDISRISRNLMVYLQFKKDLRKYDKKFFSISEPFLNDDSPVSRMLEQLLASFAEFRSGQDGDKIKEAMHRKGETGVYPGKAPYGYKNVRGQDYGGKEKRWMETDPITSVYVKEIFARYATGKTSLRQLADELNARKIPSPNKKEWCLGGIANILKKKTYIGYVDWGRVNNPNGQHEKLVDEKVFYRVQSMLKARNYGANKARKHMFLLRGLSYCGECGSRITGSYHQNKKGKIYAHYGCQKQQHSKLVACGQGAVQTKEIEKQLQKLVRTIQIPESAALRLEEKIKKVVANEKDSGEQMRKSLQMQLENIEGRKKSLFEKWMDKFIDDDTYKKYKSEMEAKELQLQDQLAKAHVIVAEISSKMEMGIKLARNCYKTYLNAPLEQKIALIQTLFEQVIIKDRKIEKALLNHPFVYICRGKVSKVPEFQYQLQGGDGGN